MMARRGVLAGVAVLGGALVVGACRVFKKEAEVHYRVTVAVDDNGTVRSGSSVWSWTLKEAGVALASPYDGKFQGEAVAVDLPGGRTLFAILRGMDGQTGMAELMPERLFGDTGRVARGEPRQFAPDRVADLRDVASRIGEVATLDCGEHPDWCPMLVTFADESDPTSVRKVEPGNLAAQFGPGVRLQSITVELTDDPVTTGIEERLPSPDDRGFFNWDGRSNPNLPGTFNISDFIKGQAA